MLKKLKKLKIIKVLFDGIFDGIFFVYKFLRHRRKIISIPIARIIGRLFRFLPKTEKSEILYPYKNNFFKLKIINQLKNQGIILSKLVDPTSINSLKSLQKELQIYEYNNTQVKIESLRKNNRNGDNKNFLRNITNHFSRSHLLCIAYDPEIIQTVYNYFGFFPSIYKINVWHNQRVAELPSSTQFFHRDPEDVSLLKLFIPLKIITLKNGPFQFISTSHKKYFKEEFTPVMAHRSATQRRLELEFELENKFKDKIFTFTGNPGDYCLVDTNGLHRGMLPKEGHRYLLNVVYCSSFPHLNKSLPKRFNPLS